jgi:putative alpha-1,2-mannosidase
MVSPLRLSSPSELICTLGSPDDFASPGYFSTNLSTGVRVELAATRRTGLHRYTFPASSTTPRILLDITNDGQISTISPELTINPETGRMMGALLLPSYSSLNISLGL